MKALRALKEISEETAKVCRLGLWKIAGFV